MIIKCNCNNCSAHLEFQSQDAGAVITCPTCGMETKLYVPPTPPPPSFSKQRPSLSTPLANPMMTPALPAESLKEVRARSCYRTLRGLINGIQLLCFIMAGLIALASILGFVATFLETSSFPGSNAIAIGGLILGLFIAIFIVVLGIAGKQAALLLVDIADCQIYLVSNRT